MFHTVVSGGGGWGLKQGLLSLDAQTRCSPTGEDDDIDGFIRSFYGEDTAGSIVTPGSFIQFLVEPPASPEAAATHQPHNLPSIAFGTESGVSDGLLGAGDKPVEIVGDHFGAVSNNGVFVDCVSPSPHSIDTRDTTRTKIDTPCSYIWEGPNRWL